MIGLSQGPARWVYRLTTSNAQFARYAALLEDWNTKINLTRIPPELTWSHHFLDSLSVASAVSPAGNVLDVGTGAGFPGVVLKIAFPDITLTVLDSIKKKLGFITAVAQDLGITVTTLGERAEIAAHDARYRERFDLVTSRAVAELSQLLDWTLPFVKVGGKCVAMKGPAAQSELETAKAHIEQLGAKVVECRPVAIPSTDLVHSLIIIEKISATPPQLPKKGNVKKSREY